VQENGHPYSRLAHDDASNNEYVFYGTDFTTTEAVLGWDWDTRNRTLFADRGMRQTISLSATVPGSNVQYYIANYAFLRYIPLWGRWNLSIRAGVDYGAPLGHTSAIPPYREFFGGGPDTIRGYQESRLGPKDQFGNPYGGNLRVVNQNELIFPMPAKWAQTARVSAFFDMGNVFQSGTKLQFFGPDGVTPEDYRFSASDLKRSVGVAVEWLAPLGLFRFSYGLPLNAKRGDGITTWGDETEGFQFSVGQAF
jgi:outer membrane protein insertion porin family